MPTSAAIGYGVTFLIYNGSTYDAVAEVTNISMPGYSRDAIDVTNQDSANSFREFIAGLMDAGEVSIDYNYIPAAAEDVLTAMLAGVGQFKIAHGAGVNVVFSAIVTDWQPNAPVDDKMSATATFKVTGRPTWAAS